MPVLMDLQAVVSALPAKPFFFMRHGETDWNKNRLTQGRTDIPLNNTGQDQASLAMSLLVGHGITKLVSSPLRRAYETAKIVNRALVLPIELHSGLVERGFGAAEGKPWAPGFVDSDLGEGSEALSPFHTRVVLALSDSLTRYPGPLLFVSHGGVYGAYAKFLAAIPDARAPNSVPFFFDPPRKYTTRWGITPVDPART
ncbi:MAG: histidine phosphatase family protein [Rhodospirillaceae bacterium]|nr:histidine phosphatase family protein [Rhodospirillaceae bacterium]